MRSAFRAALSRWGTPALSAVLCAWSFVSAAAGHVLLGLASALLFALLTVVCTRLSRLTPPLDGDRGAELERVRRLLGPLCERCGCPVPEVRVVRLVNGCASARRTRRGHALTVSHWLVTDLPDAELSAILAHELSHVVRGDCRRVQRRRLAVTVPIAAAALVYGVGFFDATTAPIVIAALGIATALLQRALAPWQRPLEARADADAVALTGDAEATALALGEVALHGEQLRRRVRGRAPLGWLLAPLVAPTGSHPSFLRRIAAVDAQRPAIA